MLTDSLRSALLELPERPPVLVPDAYKFAALYNRPERILVGARRTGKTTVARQHPQALFPPEPTRDPYVGLIDDTGDPEKTYLQIIGANRFERDQKSFAPRYKWVALIRDTTWYKISSRLAFLGPGAVGQFGFISDDFWDWLPPAALTELGQPWLRQFFDAHKRFMPEVAYMAARELGSSGTIIDAMRNACHDWVLQQTDLCAKLTWIVPDAQIYAGTQSLVMRKRDIQSRLNTYSRMVAPSPGSEFKQLALAAGVWHERTSNRCTWALPWAVGAATIKRRLTSSELRTRQSV